MLSRNRESETRIIVISPDSTVTPRSVIGKIVSSDMDLMYKETCFGVIIEGSAENVNHILETIRAMDPTRIFSKKRGYYLGDPRVCRKKRGGAARPGYHFIEMEQELLPLIGEGLRRVSDQADIEEIEEIQLADKLEPSIIKKLIQKEEV